MKALQVIPICGESLLTDGLKKKKFIRFTWHLANV